MILYILVAINSCSPGLVTAVPFHSPSAVQSLSRFFVTTSRHAGRLLHVFCGVFVRWNHVSLMY